MKLLCVRKDARLDGGSYTTTDLEFEPIDEPVTDESEVLQTMAVVGNVTLRTRNQTLAALYNVGDTWDIDLLPEGMEVIEAPADDAQYNAQCTSYVSYHNNTALRCSLQLGHVGTHV